MVLRSSLQEEGVTRKRFKKNNRGGIKSALYGLNAGFFHWQMYCKAPRNQLKNWRKIDAQNISELLTSEGRHLRRCALLDVKAGGLGLAYKKPWQKHTKELHLVY